MTDATSASRVLPKHAWHVLPVSHVSFLLHICTRQGKRTFFLHQNNDARPACVFANGSSNSMPETWFICQYSRASSINGQQREAWCQGQLWSHLCQQVFQGYNSLKLVVQLTPDPLCTPPPCEGSSILQCIRSIKCYGIKMADNKLLATIMSEFRLMKLSHHCRI